MLSVIDRYLLRHILLASLMTTGALTLVVWLSQSLRMLSMVVDSGASLLSFLHLMMLTLPTFLPIVLPLGLAAGVFFAAHQLAQDSELTVFRSAGVSTRALARPALLLALSVLVVCLFMTTTVAPAANRELVRLQGVLRNDFAPLLTRPGAFTDLDDGLVYYARTRDDQGRMEGIILHDIRKEAQPITILARRGYLARAKDGTPLLIIEDGMRQEFSRITANLEQLDFQRYVLDLTKIKMPGAERWPDPRERTMHNLTHPEGTDQHAGVRALFFAEYHSRLVTPFLSLGFTLIALVAMLNGAFNRRGRPHRILIGAAGIVLLQGMSMWLSNLTATLPPVVLALYALILLPLPLLWFLLAGADRVAQCRRGAA